MSTENTARQLVLPFLAEYHDGSPGHERKTMIEELFVPRRLTPGGFRRVPIRLPLHRRVEVRCADAGWSGLTRSIGLDRVDLDVAADDPVDVRQPLEIAIEAIIPGLWWRFLGRVTRFGGENKAVDRSDRANARM